MYQVEVSLVEIHMLGQIEILSDSDVILSFLNIWLLLKWDEMHEIVNLEIWFGNVC